MTKIKVIKRKEMIQQFCQPETSDQNTPKPAARGAVETIENWIADWRRQTEIKTRIALGELARVRIKNSIGL